MNHYGDITKINGYEVPIVDVITGGSPCQDLSVAGKRAGLAGQRSGLFMEQMRIVKEMRERDVRDFGRTGFLVRPRYMVWENVPGAFSSGNPKGADFAAVIEEIIKVAEPGAAVSVCVPDGGWTKSGCYYAEDGAWSIAWRVHDAQFWGVPQRRKRISLVADFGGLSAPEILFERKGLSGDFDESGAPGKETAGAVGGGAEGASGEVAATITATYGTKWNGNAGAYNGQNFVIEGADNVSGCLKTQPHGVCESFSIDKAITTGGNCTAGGDCIHSEYTPALTTDRPHAVCETISSQERVGKPGGGKGILIQHEHVGSLSTLNNQSVLCGINGEIAGTLDSNYYKGCGERSGVERDIVAIASSASNAEVSTNGVCPSLLARAGTGSNNMPSITSGAVVRRLTPLECERLQGYPDGWTDIGEWVDSNGKKHKDADSPRYKALGNSIALPFWQWMARRICAQYERDITMASLFDGIGGFPLVFERCGAKAVWASEIEEFPIAVTKRHFPEDEP